MTFKVLGERGRGVEKESRIGNSGGTLLVFSRLIAHQFMKGCQNRMNAKTLSGKPSSMTLGRQEREGISCSRGRHSDTTRNISGLVLAFLFIVIRIWVMLLYIVSIFKARTLFQH